MALLVYWLLGLAWSGMLGCEVNFWGGGGLVGFIGWVNSLQSLERTSELCGVLCLKF